MSYLSALLAKYPPAKPAERMLRRTIQLGKPIFPRINYVNPPAANAPRSIVDYFYINYLNQYATKIPNKRTKRHIQINIYGNPPSPVYLGSSINPRLSKKKKQVNMAMQKTKKVRHFSRKLYPLNVITRPTMIMSQPMYLATYYTSADKSNLQPL